MCLCFYNSRGDLQLLLACAATQLLSGPHSACVCARIRERHEWTCRDSLLTQQRWNKEQKPALYILASVAKFGAVMIFVNESLMIIKTIQQKHNCFLCEYIENVIYYCDAKLNFQSSVSYDPSEIPLICYFAAQETFIFVIDVENSIFKTDTIFQDSLTNRRFKRTAFLWHLL